MEKVVKAHYIKYSWISDDPRLIAKAEELAELRKAKQIRKSKRPLADAFNAILTSFEVLGVYSGDELRIPTNINLYNANTRRNPSYTTEVLDALKFLINELYIDKTADRKRYRLNYKDIWLPFRYSITPKWLEEVSDKPLSDVSLVRRNPLMPYTELRKDVWVKDNKGKQQKTKVATPVPKNQQRQHRAMLDMTDQVLSSYDDLIRQVQVTIGDTAIHPAQLFLTRVFSKGSLELGGRLYSSIQNTKKKLRWHINLNGDPTIEVDYWSIHPYLAYHSRDIAFTGDDPYTIDGFDRDLVKVAFNIMINRKGYKGHESAAKTLSSDLNIGMVEATQLEQAIQERHTPIADLFNSGAGLELQRLDSTIALQVLKSFIDRGIPIIPIHDSFIVSVRYTEDLILTMRDCYYEVLYSSQPPLDKQSFKGIKAEHRDYTEPMLEAIQCCFEGNTEDMDDLYWDNLINNEPVQAPPRVEQDCVVVDEGIE